MDSNWDAEKLNHGDLAGRVTSIHPVAYKNAGSKGDEEGLPPANHWCIFLELPGGRSVRVDMMPGYGSQGLRGKIEISSKATYVPRTASKRSTSQPHSV